VDFNGLKYIYFMFIIDESLVTVSSFSLNRLVVNKFILFHELSRSWKKHEILYVITNHKLVYS